MCMNVWIGILLTHMNAGTHYTLLANLQVSVQLKFHSFVCIDKITPSPLELYAI